MTFLEAVNRVLRSEAILMGDDDDLTSFTDTQHAATSTLAQIAIQSEIAELVSESYISYEDSATTLTVALDTRTYQLASGFQTFLELFMDKEDGLGNVEGNRLYRYPGGESQLRKQFSGYKEDSGTPIYFYELGGTTKAVGLYPVPDAAGDVYRYYYEKDVNVSVATDVIPVTTETEAQTFIRMCARHFKYLRSSPQVREALFPQGVAGDSVINQARSTLMGLLRMTPARKSYGKRYNRGP